MCITIKQYRPLPLLISPQDKLSVIFYDLLRIVVARYIDYNR